MKTISSAFLAITVFALPALSACGGTSYELQATERVPGGDVTIVVDHKGEHNHIVKVAIEHLPPSERIEPGKKHYVLWLVPPGHSPQNEGVLEYDEDERTAELEVVTPHSEFDVLVTVEKGHTPPQPSGDVITRKSIRH